MKDREKSLFAAWLPIGIALVALTAGCPSFSKQAASGPKSPLAKTVDQSLKDEAGSSSKDPTPMTAKTVPQLTKSIPAGIGAKPNLKPGIQTPDEMLLFFPSKYPAGEWQPQGLDFEDVTFESDDGKTIHAWYCPAPNPRAVVLFAHGNAGNLAHRAPVLAMMQKRMNVTVMMFDYRGYGKSKGKPTAKGAILDASAASKFLAKKANVKETDLIYMGRSLGGAVLTQVATRVQPKALVIESSFDSLHGIAKVHFPKLAWLVSKKKLNSAQAISKFHGRLLLSHGDADRTIPLSAGKSLFDAANQPKQFFLVRGRDHNDPQTESYYRELDKFFDSLK